MANKYSSMLENGNKVTDLTNVANAAWKKGDTGSPRGNTPKPANWDENSVGKPTKAQR